MWDRSGLGGSAPVPLQRVPTQEDSPVTEPGIEALIERSSLGTPGAKLLRASTSQAVVVDAILVKATQITRTSAFLTEDGHP